MCVCVLSRLYPFLKFDNEISYLHSVQSEMEKRSLSVWGTCCSIFTAKSSFLPTHCMKHTGEKEEQYRHSRTS